MTGSQAPGPPQPERMSTALSALATRARATNLIRAAEVGAALKTAASVGLDDAGWAAAERTAHQLAGSAGTFGYAAASHLARSLEHFLRQIGETDVASPGPADVDEAQVLLDQLIDQLAGEPDLD